ncbi:MAG: hypothetical protein WDO69_33650 [Pseudomonadota bacterium]
MWLQTLGGRGVSIFKLHGSVDLFVDPAGKTIKQPNFMSAVKAGLVPLIATPGISKRRVRNGLLKPLWAQAEQALKQADVIVFLGYRSPPSDPDARAFILNAISSTEPGAPLERRVHLVLGPDTNDSAVLRMEKLIQFSMESRSIRHVRFPEVTRREFQYETRKQPLYVEDFLSVVHDGELYAPAS